VPVTIEAMVANVSAEGAYAPVEYLSQPRELSDEELARKPAQYPLIVACALDLLAIAGDRLPLLSPTERGGLTPDRLLFALRQALDEVVFDLHWEHRLIDQLASRAAAAQRRSLVTMMRETDDLRSQRIRDATRLAVERRADWLDANHLETCLAEMRADGFVVRTTAAGEVVDALPGAIEAAARPFHADSIRGAVLAHLAEVRRWNLPAPSLDRQLALAREHSRVLSGMSPSQNSMLGAELRRRLEQRLSAATHSPDSRNEALFEILIGGQDLPRGPAGGLEPFDLCRQLEPLVKKAENVEAVLRAMVSEGLLQPLPPHDGRSEFADPELELLQQLQPVKPEPIEPPQAPPARQAGEPAPQVEAAASTGQPRDLKARFRLLRDLHDEGLITAEDYERRKAELLGEV